MSRQQLDEKRRTTFPPFFHLAARIYNDRTDNKLDELQCWHEDFRSANLDPSAGKDADAGYMNKLYKQLVADYKVVHAKNKVSGEHRDFAEFVHGKYAVLYLHLCCNGYPDVLKSVAGGLPDGTRCESAAIMAAMSHSSSFKDNSGGRSRAATKKDGTMASALDRFTDAATAALQQGAVNHDTTQLDLMRIDIQKERLEVERSAMQSRQRAEAVAVDSAQLAQYQAVSKQMEEALEKMGNASTEIERQMHEHTVQQLSLYRTVLVSTLQGFPSLVQPGAAFASIVQPGAAQGTAQQNTGVGFGAAPSTAP
eukprot:GHVU01155568.1.p2 GENE.GHVU01155568.1~~GHVU01155568.1.p2  ORF type:complete len:310 (-),score=51.45 GHVU01155568.1:1370-2299(-)